MSVIPSDVANLVAWFKSDMGTYQDAAKAVPCTEGTTVYTWANQVGGGFDMVQANAARRPTWVYTGPLYKPELQFITSDVLGSTHALIAQPITVFIAGKRTGFGGAPSCWMINGDAAGCQIAHSSPNPAPYIWAGGSVIQSAITIGTAPLFMCAQFNGASSFLRFNGAANASGSPGPNGVTNIHLMGDAGATYWLPGSIYEFLIYNRALTLTEIQSLEEYFGFRYGIMATALHSAIKNSPSRGSVGALRKLVVGGIDYRLGVKRNNSEGSPNPPSLEIDQPNFFAFRWGVDPGNRTISVKVKQVSNVAGLRPQLVIKADASLGVPVDVIGEAPAGLDWVTIGPVAVNPTSSGVLWVEIWNVDTDTFGSSAIFDHIVAR